MNFNEYQRACRETAIYPDKGANLVYPALKLAGEAGEVGEVISSLATALMNLGLGLNQHTGAVAEKVGKLMRDKGYQAGKGSMCLMEGQARMVFDSLTEHAEWEDSMIKELGDVLWYIATLASELGVSLTYVAQANIDKLKSRQERGVLGGSGDNR